MTLMPVLPRDARRERSQGPCGAARATGSACSILRGIFPLATLSCLGLELPCEEATAARPPENDRRQK
jgi:hypothetical protein